MDNEKTKIPSFDLSPYTNSELKSIRKPLIGIKTTTGFNYQKQIIKLEIK